jgi:hypothetical protein
VPITQRKLASVHSQWKAGYLFETIPAWHTKNLERVRIGCGCSVKSCKHLRFRPQDSYC